MNRRVTQTIDIMNLNSARLSVELCETLLDMLFSCFLVSLVKWGESFGFIPILFILGLIKINFLQNQPGVFLWIVIRK